MTETKSVLLQGRLRPRLRVLGLSDYQSYIDRVECDPAEVPVFIDLVTTNDTAFFRTPHVWDYFRSQFLPQWSAAHPGRTLKIWSAAAASGEEAYSIAMQCQEFQRTALAFRYQILATDVSKAVLATAQAGIYGGRSVQRIRETHPAMFQTYFSKQGDTATVAPILKTQIRFAEHNLLTALRPAERFDIVFLRNVLIYFEADIQKKVVDLLLPNLESDGRLVLGESESLARLQTRYRSDIPLVYTIDREAA